MRIVGIDMRRAAARSEWPVLEERKDDEQELGATAVTGSVGTSKPWPDGATRRDDENNRLRGVLPTVSTPRVAERSFTS